MHRQKADMDRLYVNRKEAGRNRPVNKLERHTQAEIINIAEYLNTKYEESHYVNIVRCHESSLPNVN